MTHPTATRAPFWTSALLGVTALGFFGAAAAFGGVTGDPADLMSVLYAVVAGVPYAALAIALLRSPGPVSYGATVMLSIMSVVIAGLFALMLLLGGVLLGLAIDVAFAGAYVLLAAWAVRRMWLRRSGAFRMLLGAGLMLFWPAVVYAVASAAHGGITGVAVGRVFARESAMIESTVGLQRCLLAYKARVGYFPATVDELNQSGSSCMDDVAPSRGRAWSLRYEPGAASASRAVASFAIHARSTGRGPFEGIPVLADHHGFLLRGSDAEAADSLFRTDGIPQQLELIRRCIVALSENGAPPRVLTAGMADSLPFERCQSFAIDRIADEEDALLQARSSGYRFTYDADGRSFRIHARPDRWGKTALRSYLLENGRIYVTLANRPATPGDVALPDCLPEYSGDCVPTPQERPPVALFVHDSIASAGRDFVLRAGVVGAPDRAPEIQVAFDCNAQWPLESASPLDSITGNVTYDNPATCRLSNGVASIGQQLVVRMWLGKGGRFWVEEDTVPVAGAPTGKTPARHKD